MVSKGKKKSSVRDTWIPDTWRYNGAGIHKTRKKELYRKRKHKGEKYDKDWEIQQNERTWC